MSERAADFESLLRQALAPIEPPAELEARLESTSASLVDAAADELEAWELSAMRDPRNWARLAVAGAAGGAAARRARAACARSAGATAGAPPPTTCSSSPSTPSATSRARRAS